MCLAIPGKIVEVYQRDELPMAKVEFGGVRKEVCLAYTPEAEVGEYVLVHVGFALSRIDEQEAQEIFDSLAQIAAAGDFAETKEPAEAAEFSGPEESAQIEQSAESKPPGAPPLEQNPTP